MVKKIAEHLNTGSNNDREVGKEIQTEWTVSLKILRLAYLERRKKTPVTRVCRVMGKLLKDERWVN